jgi:hypothetical protein
MTAAHAIIVIGGSVFLMSVMIVWMRRANRRERVHMRRRTEEWMANGAKPDDKPNFYAGSAGSGSGG